MNRRVFLAGPAACSLHYLLGCGGASPPQDAWSEALEHMKRTGRFGALLVAPRDPGEKLAFGRRLFEDFERPSPALRNLLDEAVVIVVDAGSLHAGPGSRPMIILDSSGAEIGAVREPLVGDFAATARALIDGRSTPSKDAPPRRLPFGVTVETGQVPIDVPCAYCGLDGPYRQLDVGKFFKLLGD